jgi:hypothetical protein
MPDSDAAQRLHTLTVHLAADHPATAPTWQCALPGPFAPPWGRDLSLVGLLAHFRAALARHQDLWDMLDELDAKTCVLEPENPLRNMTWRRIAVGMETIDR